MTAANINEEFVMSDDMFLGVFDTDGSVLIVFDQYKSGGQPFGVRVLFFLGQSNKKRDLVKKVASKFNCSVTENKEENRTELRVGPRSPAWKHIRQFLLTNQPLHPARRRDFLISEKVNEWLLAKKHLTKQGLITLIKLAFGISKESIQKNNREKKTFDYWVNLVNSSETEKELGLKEANDMLADIENKISQLENDLPNKVLSQDYIRGAHYGDGGLTVALAWNPHNKTPRLRCVPEWTISGENEAYCKSFVKTLGIGDLNRSSDNCLKYRCSGISKCEKHFLPLLSNERWMPQYKRQQFNRFKMAVRLLKNKDHFTVEGIQKLVHLVFDLGEKGGRKGTKEDYISWGCQILRNNGRIE